MNWTRAAYIFFMDADHLFLLFFNRMIFAAAALSILIALVMLARKNRAPGVRSWLWGLCLPALIVPFERSAMILRACLLATANEPGFPLIWSGLFQQALFGALNSPFCRYIWLAGFVLHAAKTRAEYKKTLRLLSAGKISSCASYFYRGASRIYTPPNFEEAYLAEERKLLLAHEKQHIKQHDPLLYRFLQGIQCFFWFLPLVHKAVKLIRQDRELLCDDRVTFHCSKRKYGMLLLSEAKKAAENPALAGIVSEPGGIYERVTACVQPLSGSKSPAVIVTAIAVALFAAGSVGFVRPVAAAPMTIAVCLADDAAFSQIAGMEKYILIDRECVHVDEKGLYEYAVSIGMKPEQRLLIVVNEVERMFLGGSMTVSTGGAVTIRELESANIFYPRYDAGFNLWNLLFKAL